VVLKGKRVVEVVHLHKQSGVGGGGGGSSHPGHPLLSEHTTEAGNRSEETKVVGVVDPTRPLRFRYVDGAASGDPGHSVGVGDVSWGGDKSKLGINTCHERAGLGFVTRFSSLSLVHHH